MNAPKKNPKDNDNQSGNSSARFEQQILDTSSIGVLITRIGDGAILYANKTIASLLGIADVNSIIGRPAPDLYWDPKDRQMLLERFHTEGSITGNEIRARRFDGHMVWVSISIQSFSFEGEQVLLSEITDITARKQTEEALRASEEQFRSIYDNATIGLYRTTPDGRILMINPTGLRLLGFDSFDEISQRNLEESGFEQEDARKQFREKLEHEGTISLESEWKRKDGSSIYVHEGAKVFRNENGEILYYDGSFEDITERKRAENALQESERLLQLVMDNIPQAVFWKDKELAFMGGNQAVAEDAGLDSPQYLVGKTDFDMPWKDRAELYHADDQQVLELGEAKLNYEEMQTSPTGKQTWLRTSKIPMRDINGKIFAVLGMYEDITERKQAEAEIARYVSIIENSTDFIGMGRPDSQAFYLNRGARQMLGIDLQSPAEDYSILTLQAPSVLEQITQEVMPTAIEKGAWVGESAMVHTDGHEIPVSMSVLCHRDANGNILYFSNIARDISERKHLEHEIQESFERRGYQVQVSTEISQEVAAASELNDLFDRVVTLTKERLGYYHTQLLRYDATQDAVILINGYGEIGAKMLAGGHKMPMGRGLIGTAAASGKIVMRPTLADDPDWQPNPLLPETKGEIAVPIKLGEQILGVLDVQSDQAGAITEDDRLLLEGLCGQIAIAMQSAELVKAIRENEARLAEALRTARLANWEYDVEKDIFTFNDQFYSIFHTTAEKAGGYQLSSARYAELFVHPDDMEVVGMEIGKALSSKERVYNTTLDHRIVYEDGGIGYITVKLTVERDENGKITRYYGANQDITERKLAEEALASERRLLRVLMSTMLDLVYVKDSEHRFLLASDTVVRSLGAETSDEVVGKTDFDFHPRELAEQYQSDEKSLMESGLPLIDHEESAMDHATGAFRWLSSTKAPLRDSQGNVIGLVGLNRDITERKQAEEALRVNEARLAEALRTARLANWEYDVEKDLFTFNDQFYSIFHTTVEKAGGYQLSSARYAELFVHPDDREVVGAEIGKALSSTERVYNAAIDHRILYEDGSVGYITVKLTVERDENGKITRNYGANQDITERKQAEEALRRSEQEMSERLEEISRLYRTMSHEGWSTYRETTDLPKGFMFDQNGIKPLEDASQPEKSFAHIPMKVLGGEVVGDLAIADDPQHPISLEDIDFLQQVSDQVALALEGARLSAQTQSALAQTEKLSEAGLLFTRASDLQKVVKIAVETLGISKINRAALETFNYNGNEVESMDVIANWWNGTGHETTAVGTHYSLEVLPLIQLFITANPIFIKDAFQDDRIDSVSLQIVKKLNIHAVAVLPLFLAENQIGVLLLESEEIHEFNQDEIRLFSAMGPQISTVLENRRQFERAQKQAERESTLNIISQKIQSATTVEAVLQIAARELGHALGAPMTIAQLSMKDKK